MRSARVGSTVVAFVTLVIGARMLELLVAFHEAERRRDHPSVEVMPSASRNAAMSASGVGACAPR